MRTVFFAFTLYFASIFSASAVPLESSGANNITVANTEQSFKLAGIYWLPDYLKENVDTNHRIEDDKGGADIKFDCEENGYSSSPCVAPQTQVAEHNMVTHVCYECACPTGYIYFFQLFRRIYAQRRFLQRQISPVRSLGLSVRVHCRKNLHLRL